MIEIVAMVTMLIDHIGFWFFPQSDLLRIIGRLAFPLYLFGIYKGYQYTSNLKIYMLRLLGLAVLSQLPYMLYFGVLKLNIIFTLLLCLFLVFTLEKVKWIWHVPTIVAFCLIAELFFSYGSYAILMMVVLYYAKNVMYLIGGFILFNAYYHFLISGWYVQWFSILSLFFIVYFDHMPKIKLNRLFYRLFYPGHLIVLVAVKLLFLFYVV